MFVDHEYIVKISVLNLKTRLSQLSCWVALERNTGLPSSSVQRHGTNWLGINARAPRTGYRIRDEHNDLVIPSNGTSSLRNNREVYTEKPDDAIMASDGCKWVNILSHDNKQRQSFVRR